MEHDTASSVANFMANFAVIFLGKLILACPHIGLEQAGTANFCEIDPLNLRAARLQNEVCTEDLLRATKLPTKNAPKFAPNF